MRTEEGVVAGRGEPVDADQFGKPPPRPVADQNGDDVDVPPDQALACLNRISACGGSRQVQYLIADATIDHAPQFLDQCARLPLPHPADSEFRFFCWTESV